MTCILDALKLTIYTSPENVYGDLYCNFQLLLSGFDHFKDQLIKKNGTLIMSSSVILAVVLLLIFCAAYAF